MLNVKKVIERRDADRWNLIKYLSIYDEKTDNEIGRIVDISETGIKIISKYPIPIDNIDHIYFDAPMEEDILVTLSVEVEMMWSGLDVNPDLYAAGCCFRNLNPTALLIIRHLIDNLRFDNSA